MYKYSTKSKNLNLYLSDFIILVGTLLEDSDEALPSFIKNKLKDNTTIIYFSPIDYNRITDPNIHFIKYEIESEEAILALLLKYFLNNQDNLIKKFIKELDIGYLSAEINIGEDEFEYIKELSKTKSKHSIFIGNDIINHNKIFNIIILLMKLDSNTFFDIFMCNNLWSKYKKFIQDPNCTKELDEISQLNDYNGIILYKYKKSNSNSNILMGSQTLAKLLNIKDNDTIYIKLSVDIVKAKFTLNNNLNGNIGLLIYSKDIEFYEYPYQNIKIFEK